MKRPDAAFVVDKRHFDTTEVAHARIAVESVFIKICYVGGGVYILRRKLTVCATHACALTWLVIHSKFALFTSGQCTRMCSNMVGHP